MPGGLPTAGEVIDRIKQNADIPWRERTVDNLIAGSPATNRLLLSAFLDLLLESTNAIVML